MLFKPCSSSAILSISLFLLSFPRDLLSLLFFEEKEKTDSRKLLFLLKKQQILFQIALHKRAKQTPHEFKNYNIKSNMARFIFYSFSFLLCVIFFSLLLLSTEEQDATLVLSTHFFPFLFIKIQYYQW